MAEFLDQPAAAAAATIALGFLDDAAAAATRLGDASDRDALHDFRVAIRRLRVTLRGYPAVADALSRKQRRRLRKLARRTNPARDAEVQLAWFRERTRRFSREQRATLEPLRGRLRTRHRRQIARTADELREGFAKLERKLRRRLTAPPADPGARDVSFGALAAAALVRHAHDLDAQLQQTPSETDPLELHTTRIAAKRLRYLLEPLVPALEQGGGGTVVERLKALQDLLGALTDGHELATALQVEQNAGEGATAALRILQAEARSHIARLRKEFSGRPDLRQRVDRIVQQLRGAPPPPLDKPPSPPSMRQRTRRRRAPTV